MNNIFTILLLLLALYGCGSSGKGSSGNGNANNDAATEIWRGTVQFGGASNDRGNDIALDGSGNIYLAGVGYSSADVSTNYPLFAKFSASGESLWLYQFTAINGAANSAALSYDGGVYFTGRIDGSFEGSEYQGQGDAFLIKFDSSGALLWYRQFGTGSLDNAYDVAVDASGNVYVTGLVAGPLFGNVYEGVWNAFVSKYDPSGNRLWTKQLTATSVAYGKSIAVDVEGNSYIAGIFTPALDGNQSLGGNDFFIAKFDVVGGTQWIETFGSPGDDDNPEIAVDANGNIYVAGQTNGAVFGQTNQGGTDVFIAKFDNAGNNLWTRQTGSANLDECPAVAVDLSQNVCLAARIGLQRLNLITYVGGEVLFNKYTTDGDLLFSSQFGSTETDTPEGLAVNSNGSAFITGYTRGSIDGREYTGAEDVFIVKYDPIGNKL